MMGQTMWGEHMYSESKIAAKLGPIKNENKVFIPAKEKGDIYEAGRIFRTCAYCRVSTDSEEQLSSYELQKEHYESLAGKHPNWLLKKVYADEGISGTSLKKRDDFNEMIAACERGEYDLILTKSVSRFARNLVDCISLVRRLKNHNPPIGVFFETDNLFTLSEDSELKLSLLATFAQEESVKKSESMVWSLKERFKTDKLLMPDVFGYRRPRDSTGKKYVKDSRLEIVESEAEVVRFIFDAFLAGYSKESIAEILTEIGCPTKTGRTDWSEGSISYILRNERYCGHVLTWKTFTADIFEHKKRKNCQDRDQYLYTGKHDAIISAEKFEAAQTLLANKRHHVRGGIPRMHVIDEGIFKGYVPVNHRWINDDPHMYFEASNSVITKNLVHRIHRQHFSAFDLSGYQVVRGQFMTRKEECPCITISAKKISFNAECVRKFHDISHVQLLIHPTERRIAIRPCAEKDAHSIRWRIDSERPIFGKAISCQYFNNALFQIMEWNPDYQYRVRGTWVSRNDDEIIVFDVSKAMPFIYITSKRNDPSERKQERLNLCPQDWEGSFGEEFYEFSLQNSFYYIRTNMDWNAKAKSHAVPDSTQVPVLSPDELQMNIENLRTRVGLANAE